MSDKYGRLFTEADVLAIVDEALMAGTSMGGSMEEILDVLIERAEADKAPMRFPADEPLFLLRGQDVNAPGAVDEYERNLLCYADEVSDEFTDQVAAAGIAMREWQAANPYRVKIPD